MRMDDKTLKTLVRLAQSGDKGAYRTLLLDITPPLRFFLSKRINLAEDVEDVLQEVLLAVHKARHTYNSDRSFVTWLFAIVTYKLNDYLRRHYSRQEYRNIDYCEVAEQLEDHVTNWANTSEYPLEELLEGISEKQQKIILLMKVEGYTASEVAHRLGMSVSAVKVSAHRAYKVLRERIEAEEKA